MEEVQQHHDAMTGQDDEEHPEDREVTATQPESAFYFEAIDLTPDLHKPLKGSSRLRYTCSDVSPNVTPILDAPSRYLALGTTSGSVHVFQYSPPPSTIAAPPPSSVVNRIPSNPSTDSLVNSDTSQIHSTSTFPLSIHHAFTQHTLSVIHEDLLGPITCVAFAPIQVLVTDRPDDGSPAGSSDEFNNSSHSSQDSSDHDSGSITHPNHRPQHNNGITRQHQLNNILLAIGSSKGSLLVVDINLHYTEQGESSLLKFGRKRWSVAYQSSLFTRDSINLLRWDNSNRLFITDSSGKLFVLPDIEEMSQLMIPSSPTLLVNLHGVSIHQLDIAEKLIILATATEQRVLLLNSDSSSLTQIGKVTAPRKKKARDRFQASGVCALFTYRLVEITSYHYGPPDYGQKEEEWASTKAYRLVGTDCQLFATRPKCRLWAVDLDGNVQFTHQFSELIDDLMGDSSVVGDQQTIDNIFTLTSSTEQTQHNFGKLYPMYWRDPLDSLTVLSYLVTYTDTCPCRLFVLDLNEQTILAASPPLAGTIRDLKCIGNDIYVTYQGQDASVPPAFKMCVLTLVAKNHFEENDSLERSNSLSSLMSHDASESNSPIIDETAEIISTSTQLNINPHLERAQLLHQYLMGQSPAVMEADHFVSKCACGLPLPTVRDCDQFDSLKLVSVLGSGPLDQNVALYLLEMAFSSGNWPLYMHLLAQLGESKFYLYFAILLNEPCLISRHWNIFGRDTTTSEALWQDIFEYIGLCIFSKRQQQSDAIESSSAQQSNYPKAIQDISQNSLRTHTLRCSLCELKALGQADQWQQVVNWFERHLLRYCLLYCSTDFVIQLTHQIIARFLQPKNGALLDFQMPATIVSSLSMHSTQLFPLQFYLLLLRFEVMKLSTNRFSEQVLERLKCYFANQRRLLATAVNNNQDSSSNNQSNSISSSDNQPTDKTTIGNGWIVNLARRECSFCERPILPPGRRHAALIRRQIKLYRNCGHIFHSTCSLSRRCGICSRRASS